MNKETHAEFMKLIEDITINDINKDEILKILMSVLDYDIELELVKASIYDVSLI